MQKKLLYIITIMLVSFLPSVAQDDIKSTAVEAYESAIKSYDLGNFDDAEAKLLSTVKSLDGKYKTNAYRILTLCQLKKGHEQQAREYIRMLLANDPYYSPWLDDTQRLTDLVNEEKSRSANITAASQQAESIDEAPVPVTVITEDMIRYSGASTIQELLCLYVPGMSNIEGMGANIALHGVYGFFQDKILFLQDGNRLNSSCSNAETPDYRNCLDKIQQIEVLRGAASSLYGEVALTAVVNIITKKGASMNGCHISGTAGTQKTYGAAITAGGGNNVMDIFAWGSFNATNGFKHTIQNEVGGYTTLYSNAYNRRPSYDCGVKARWKDFTVTATSKRSKKNQYINPVQVAAVQSVSYDTTTGETVIMPSEDDYNGAANFNVDKYADINGDGPGYNSTSHHIGIEYNHTFGKVNLLLAAFATHEDLSLYNVVGDSVNSNIENIVSAFFKSTTQPYIQFLATHTSMTQGVFEIIDSSNNTFGGCAQGLIQYNCLGNGSLLLGTHYEHYTLTNGRVFMGGNYTADGMTYQGTAFYDQPEQTISAYAQIKHYFTSRLLVNLGLRYDYKDRFDENNTSFLSPRFSIIYKINKELSARFAYNSSADDIPHFFRACKVPLFTNNLNVPPEKSQSVIATLFWNHSASKFTAELSTFYNSLSDLSINNYSAELANSGSMQQIAVDAAVNYNSEPFFASINASWQRVLSSSNIVMYNNNRVGVPHVIGSAVAAWTPYIGKGNGFIGAGKLSLNANATMQTKTSYLTYDLLHAVSDATTKHYIITEVPAQLIIGFGATYQWKYLDLDITVKNITNREYMVGSTLQDGIPHAGRQLLGKITIKF